jgi:crossover junction endodeoxyribonuclease RuvC
MIVLGVDPGTVVTGYGVVDRDGAGGLRLIECGVVRPRAGAPLAVRLQTIFEGITEIIARHRPDAVAVEAVFVHKNVRSALILGHGRGVILLAAAQAGLAVTEYPPATIKKAVAGAGAATKAQIQQMVARILRLKTPPAPTDAADGVAVALTHAVRSGRVLRRAVVG